MACGWSGTKSPRSLEQRLKATWTTMHEYPSTMLVPLLAFAVLTAAGVVGVLEASKAQSQHDRSIAAMDAQFAALSMMQELQSVVQPSAALGSFIAVQPDFNLVNSSFNVLAKQLLQLDKKLSDDTYIEIQPFGHVVNVEPPNRYALASLGVSVFDIPLRVQDLNNIVKANRNSLRGPLLLYSALPNGSQAPSYNALLCQYPVMVPNSTHDATFNIPFNLSKNCVEDICFDAASKSKLWGFVTTVIPVEPLLNSNDSGLSSLRNKGYNYRLVQVASYLNATPGYTDPVTQKPASLLASYGDGWDDPVIATIDVPDVLLFTPWTLMVSQSTWTPDWQDPLIAAVVIVSAVISTLLYILLLYMNEHARLLHVLMPRKLAKTLISNGYDDLVAKSKEQMGSQKSMTMFQSGTPVDKLMEVLSQALMGKVPDLSDVLAVRQAIMLGGGADNLFQPANLHEQLEMNSKLEDDVVRGLVRELRGLDPSPSIRPSFGDSSKTNGSRNALVTLNLIPAGADMEEMETALGVVLGAAIEPALLQGPCSQASLSGAVVTTPTKACSLRISAATGWFTAREERQERRPSSGGLLSPPLGGLLPPPVKQSPAFKSTAGLPTGVDCMPVPATPNPYDMPLPQQSLLLLPADKVLHLLEEGYANFDFSVFPLAELTQDHALSALLFFLIKRTGILQDLGLDAVKVARLCLAIDEGYKPNPYHNRSHAADVLQSFHTLIVHSGMVVAEGDKGYCDPTTLLACLFAAASHDLEHVGSTNDFLIATEDDLAVLYSDKSPMEHHHLACLFKLLKKRELNILSKMSKCQRSRFRKTIIELICATDMKLHFSTLSQFSTLHRLAASSQSSWDHPTASEHTSAAAANGASASEHPKAAARLTPVDDAQHIISLQVALKCADICNLARSREDSARWSLLLEEEFFAQGDKERALGLPISPLFDRSKPGVASGLVGFYDVVGLPLFHNFTCAFPGARPFFNAAFDNYSNYKSKKKLP